MQNMSSSGAISGETVSSPIFLTERLTFRELALSDAPFVLDLLTQPSFLEFIGDRGVFDRASAEDYIRDVRAQYQDPGYGSYCVVLKETGIPVGISGLIKRQSLPHVDMGFAYLPEHWRQGYAFEGAKALLHYAEIILGLETVIAITNRKNTASQKLLEKLGMRADKSISSCGEDVLLYAPIF